MGSWAAQILHEHGGRVVAVSDAFGAVANEHGLQVPELRQHVADKHRWGLLVGGTRGAGLWRRRCCRRSCRIDAVAAAPAPSSLASFAGGVVLPKENILSVPCDVLIPAAIGGVIDETNAADLQCKVRAAG